MTSAVDSFTCHALRRNRPPPYAEAEKNRNVGVVLVGETLRAGSGDAFSGK